MPTKKRSLIAFLLAAVAVSFAHAEYRLVLQSGHEGTVVGMAWHAESKTVVTAGEDGRIIITRPEDGKVLHRFRVTEGSIRELVVDPSGTRAAVVQFVDDGYSVSVWDWTTEENVFEYNLDSEPLFASWSAKGRYLTLGTLGESGILILEGQTGKRLPYLQRRLSIFNSGYIGSTETILMGYSSSGTISYLDIRSSSLKFSTETIANLQDLSILQTGSKATMFARNGGTLYLINRQTGAVQDQLEVPGFITADMDENTGEVDVISSDLAGVTIHRYIVRDEHFNPRVGNNPVLPEQMEVTLPPMYAPVRILRKGGATYVADESGRLLAETDGSFAPLIPDKLWRPDAIDLAGESLYLSGPSRVLRFTSLFFAGEICPNINDLTTLTKAEIETDSAAANTGIVLTAGGFPVKWYAAPGGGPASNGLRILDFSENRDDRVIGMRGFLQNVKDMGRRRLLLVDRSGTVRLFGLASEEVESEYSALGILDAAYSREGEFILAGRSSTGRAGTPLEAIDIETRESIPVPDERFMVYSVEAGDSYLYSLGVKRMTNGSVQTQLVRHDAERPDQSTVVYSIPGEDLDALIVPEAGGSNNHYTTLGGRVMRLSGSRRVPFPWDEEIRTLAVRGTAVYGIDADGSLAIWNASSGEALLRVYFFNDGGWIALPPDGDRVWASPGAIGNVALYRNGREVDPRRVSRIQNDSPESTSSGTPG